MKARGKQNRPVEQPAGATVPAAVTVPAAGSTARGPGILFAAAGAYLAVFGLEAYYIPPLMHAAQQFHAPMVLGALLIALGLGAGIWVAYLTTRLPIPPAPSLLIAILLSLAWAGLTFEQPIHWLRSHSGWIGVYLAAATLSLALAASFLGRGIAAAFKDRNLVAAGALVGAVIDYWGVNSRFGSTHLIVTHHPHLQKLVSVHLPYAGIQVPLVGPGDYVFIGIMFALVHRFNLQPTRTALLMWALLVGTMVAVMLENWSIPGVVPMAAAVILPNIAEFHFKREEMFAVLYAGALLAALAAGWWWSHQGAIHAHR